MDSADRRAVWDSYGRFAAFVCCTSALGVLQDIAFMRASAAFFLELSLPLQQSSLPQLADVAQAKSEVTLWLGAALVLDSAHNLFLFISRFLVIVRLMEFALARTGRELERSLESIRRVALVVVSAVCVCGIVGGSFAASYFSKAGFYYQNAANILRSNTDDCETRAIVASSDAMAYELRAHQAINVAAFSTIAEHLLLLICYAISGAYCYRRFTAHPVQQAIQLFNDPSVLPSLRKLQVQIASVVLVAFLTLLIRTVYLLVNAAYNLTQNGIAACFTNTVSFESVFYELPEVQVLSRSLEASVALLVALWGLTSERTWELLKQNKSLKDSLLCSPESAFSRMKSQLLG